MQQKHLTPATQELHCKLYVIILPIGNVTHSELKLPFRSYFSDRSFCLAAGTSS